MNLQGQERAILLDIRKRKWGPLWDTVFQKGGSRLQGRELPLASEDAAKEDKKKGYVWKNKSIILGRTNNLVKEMEDWETQNWAKI